MASFDLTQPVFPINASGRHYSLVLPDWKTDYIQGMLAEKAVPYELGMLQAMDSFLRGGDLVLDVGANIGNHTLYLAMIVGCRVVAFEPNPILSTPLQQSIAINGVGDRVALVCKGVGAVEARAVFADLNPANLGAQSLALIDQSSQGDLDAVDSVGVIALDSIKFDAPVKAIKIDVEGMELDVLEGAKRLIESSKPNLFIESQDEEQFLAVHDTLWQWGYVYWSTFNATPTNWFIPLDHANGADLQQHGLEQGKAFYKLWKERQQLRRSLIGLRKQHEALQNQLIASKHADLVKGANENDADRLPEKPLSFDFSDKLDQAWDFAGASWVNNSEHKKALGLDFSVSERSV